MTRFKRNAFFVPRVGGFVCVNSPNVHKQDMNHPLWQTIGEVKRVEFLHSSSTPLLTVLFPGMKEQYVFRADVRRATAQEGEMAFWNPAQEEREWFAKQEQREQKRREEARAKVEQANLTVSDF